MNPVLEKILVRLLVFAVIFGVAWAVRQFLIKIGKIDPKAIKSYVKEDVSPEQWRRQQKIIIYLLIGCVVLTAIVILILKPKVHW